MRNRLLIVDDDTASLMSLSNILQAEYKIYTAKDGTTAIKKAEKYLPDIILLDVLMPGMDGYTVLAALKKIEKVAEIPVIFITGLSKAEDEEKGLLLGAVDYISKPFNATIATLRVQHQIRIVNQMRLIKRLSLIDQLTELPNRRSFDDRLRTEWAMAVREKLLLSLLMIDLDRFKNFNDAYGHLQGDAALHKVAGIFTRTLKRTTDFAARWGGEEFVILLPNTDCTGSTHIAEEIRNNVESADIPLPDGSSARVTVSIGVNTMAPTRNDSSEKFFSGADDALYVAKKAGRNRVRLYDGAVDAGLCQAATRAIPA